MSKGHLLKNRICHILCDMAWYSSTISYKWFTHSDFDFPLALRSVLLPKNCSKFQIEFNTSANYSSNYASINELFNWLAVHKDLPKSTVISRDNGFLTRFRVGKSWHCLQKSHMIKQTRFGPPYISLAFSICKIGG